MLMSRHWKQSLLLLRPSLHNPKVLQDAAHLSESMKTVQTRNANMMEKLDWHDIFRLEEFCYRSTFHTLLALLGGHTFEKLSNLCCCTADFERNT